MVAVTKLSYSERAKLCLSPLAKRLFNLLDEKKTNLGISLDVTKAETLLEIANTIGPDIAVLKTHIDIITDFTPALIDSLKQLALKHRFFIFEDRKFADIGNTVKSQYAGGMYQIASWADFVNAHTLPGPGIIKALAEVGRPLNRGLILLAEMSSNGHLMNEAYVQKTLQMAEEAADFIIGFITQRALSTDPHWLYLTPGVKLDLTPDQLGQQYVSPETAVLENGADIILVGRGIINAENPKEAAQSYRKAGWDAYLARQK